MKRNGVRVGRAQLELRLLVQHEHSKCLQEDDPSQQDCQIYGELDARSRHSPSQRVNQVGEGGQKGDNTQWKWKSVYWNKDSADEYHRQSQSRQRHIGGGHILHGCGK